MNAHQGRDHARRIGALAGLAPTAVALVLVIVLGASPSRDTFLWLGLIAVVAVGAGWLIGPRVGGSYQSDLWVAVGYALVGSFVYILVWTAIAVSSGPASEGDRLPALAWRVIGQVLYGLLYLPFWAGGLTPFAVVWVVAVRGLRRHAGLPSARMAPEVARSLPAGRRVSPRRMGLFAGVLIAGYALFVALLPLLLYHEPRSPWWIYRPVALVVLFLVPAAIAVIGAIRSRRSLLIAAGVICLLQAYVSFSGVTIGFMIPAILLLVLGARERWPGHAREPRAAVAASVVVIALTMAAWVATLGMTEELCWTSTANPDGSLTYERVPISDTTTILPGQAASGCDGGTLTVEGMGVGAVLAIGAVAIAAASAVASRDVVAPA